jgi:hypothetical protein
LNVARALGLLAAKVAAKRREAVRVEPYPSVTVRSASAARHPQVSVVVPAHNAQATLSDTLTSLQAQTYGDWEAIVIDDGSTDSTSEIATQFASTDRRIRLVRQDSAGESAARNTGVTAAAGEWLVFLDADDWLLPSYLERMLKTAFDAGAQVGVVHCGWMRVTEDGRSSQGMFAPAGRELFPELARYNCFAIHACVIRSSLVRDVGLFDVGLRTCPDWDLWQRVARRGACFIAVPEVLACYRIRVGSAGMDPQQLLSDAMTVISRGHRPDHRVAGQDQPYPEGAAAGGEAQARLEFTCWAAGLAIGRGQPASELLGHPQGAESIDSVSPSRVAELLFESVPLPAGELTSAWSSLWSDAEANVDGFLSALENHSRNPGLAVQAKSKLMHKILTTAVPAVRIERGVHPAGADRSASDNRPSPFAHPRRIDPVSREWGFDRGLPVDRFYIERFLSSHRDDVKGRVLEVGDNSYTVRFGGDRVTRSDVLHVVAGNEQATIIADLTDATHVPGAAFDCLILTQTLQLIFDLPAALRTIVRILKPGGVLLATVPGLTRTSQTEWPESWFWRLTPASARRLAESVFPAENVQVQGHGNVLAACAFLYGLAMEELTVAELSHQDPDYDVIITLRAVKPAAGASSRQWPA